MVRTWANFISKKKLTPVKNFLKWGKCQNLFPFVFAEFWYATFYPKLLHVLSALARSVKRRQLRNFRHYSLEFCQIVFKAFEYFQHILSKNRETDYTDMSTGKKEGERCFFLFRILPICFQSFQVRMSVQ